MRKRRLCWAVVIILLGVSLAGNVYWCGKQWLDRQMATAFNTGVNAVRNSIVEMVERDGVVFITNKDGQTIKLIKEIKDITK